MPTLKPYQEEARDFFVDCPYQGRGLFDETGVGKTAPSIVAARDRESVHNIVVTLKIMVYTWALDEIPMWYPEARTIVLAGTPQEREQAEQDYLNHRYLHPHDPVFLVANWAQLPRIKTLVLDEAPFVLPHDNSIETVILDECHTIKSHKTGLNSRKSNPQPNTWDYAKALRTDYRYLLTGTPMSLGPRDLWAYLHLMDPPTFRAYWPWIKANCVIEKGYFGQQIKGPLNPLGLKASLKPYILRRLKKHVLPQLSKSRPSIRVNHTPGQHKLYRELARNLMVETGSEERPYFLVQNPAELTVRLRQINVSPKLLGSPLTSAALTATTELVRNTPEPLVIFTPFREGIPLVEEAVQRGGAQETYCIQGGMRARDLYDAVQKFENSANSQRALIATITLSAGFTVVSASKALFVGMEWSPTPHKQAEDRLDRLGQTNHVTCYYIVNNGTIDERHVEVIGGKIHWETLTLHPEEILFPNATT